MKEKKQIFHKLNVQFYWMKISALKNKMKWNVHYFSPHFVNVINRNKLTLNGDSWTVLSEPNRTEHQILICYSVAYMDVDSTLWRDVCTWCFIIKYAWSVGGYWSFKCPYSVWFWLHVLWYEWKLLNYLIQKSIL